jgi:uncharacterized protein with PQ loop repeat
VVNVSATADIIGWIAAGISTVISLPQAAKIFQMRHSTAKGKFDGVALGTWVLVTVNAVLWFIYAILAQAYPVGFPSLINGPLGIYVILSVMKDRKGK